MHPLESGMGVPAFLAKLWRLVEDSSTNNLISWSTDGRSFIIQNQAKFAKELLPLNYKHNNMASFIRQLNMYGFHKITSIDNGGLRFEKDEMEFTHPYFQKGHPYLLEHIKRKIANPKTAEVEKATTKTETVNRVLSEVKNMRGRQESLDTRFSAMKQENEALWREVAILRQKHMKQQQIVNKLIQFLVTIVQPQRGGLNTGIGKRRCQLMINDAPQSKMRKANEGPVIRELTEELLDEVDSDLDDSFINIPNVHSPGSQSSKGSSSLDDYTPPTLMPDILTNYINNNYGNNYLVADQDGTSNAADALDLDDIDEIDTNNMAIYSGAPIKRSQKPDLKQEPVEIESVPLPEKVQVPKSSLLVPANDNGQTSQQEIDADLMLNVLGDQATRDDIFAGTSGLNNTTADPAVPQHTLFDETSQPPNNLLDDELFSFGGKTGEQEKAEDMIVTKYKPKHAHDIMRLNSVHDYSSHLDSVQNELDSLKDLLSNDPYQTLDPNLMENQNVQLPIYMPSATSFDADTINKLFGNDDIVGYELSPSNMDLFADDKKGNSAQSELMNYQPSPYNNSLDFNELLQQNVSDVEVQND